MKRFTAILLILVMLFAMCSVVFADPAEDVVSPKAGDHDHDEPSPQTGDLTAYVIAAAVLALGLALFCGKKLVKEK